jgi:predicted transcriptional regulator
MTTTLGELRKTPMKFRNKTDIMAEILKAANGGSTRTKLMYKAFLRYEQLREYLAVLNENGLLTLDEVSMTFRTTPKGYEFVDAYKRLNEISGLAVTESPRTQRKKLTDM